MGIAFVKFSVGREGASSANLRYITRERATEGNGERVWSNNLPHHAVEGETYKERTGNMREYVRQREEDELERSRTGGGHTRTHYRAIYSFDREVTDEQAKRTVDNHLKQNFARCGTVAAIHRDTDNTHVHVWIDARGTDGKKLDLGHRTYRTLDEKWAKECAREFGDRTYYDRHMEAKQGKVDQRKEAVRAKQEGRAVEPQRRPVTSAELKRSERAETARASEREQYGARGAAKAATGIQQQRAGERSDDQSGVGRDQRRVADADHHITAGERALVRWVADSKRAIESLNRSFDGFKRAHGMADETAGRLEQTAQRFADDARGFDAATQEAAGVAGKLEQRFDQTRGSVEERKDEGDDVVYIPRVAPRSSDRDDDDRGR